MRTKCCLPALLFCAAAGPPGAGPARPEVDQRWLDRLDAGERACLERLIGFAPPPFDGNLAWTNAEPMLWKDLRGSVVVIQSWTSRTAAGRNWAMRAARNLEAMGDAVTLIALHTPEGADTAGTFLGRRRLDVPVAIDGNGAFCDALGVYKRPVNVVVDRNGTVRYAGLNRHGLRKAVALLATEPATSR